MVLHRCKAFPQLLLRETHWPCLLSPMCSWRARQRGQKIWTTQVFWWHEEEKRAVYHFNPIHKSSYSSTNKQKKTIAYSITTAMKNKQCFDWTLINIYDHMFIPQCLHIDSENVIIMSLMVLEHRFRSTKRPIRALYLWMNFNRDVSPCVPKVTCTIAMSLCVCVTVSSSG